MRKRFLAACSMSKPRTPSDPSKKEHPLRDLLMILGILLAALQVIPMYVNSKGVMGIIIGATLLVCIVSYFFLRYTGRFVVPWKQAALPLGLVILFGGIALYSQISLRAKIAELGGGNPGNPGSSVLLGYLDGVFDEHAAQWNGEFEKRYARPTLYLLSSIGTDAKPTEVQNSILLWRSGSEGVAKEFMGVAGLAGETLPTSSPEIERTAQRYMSYVQRPMADSDLLNRNTYATNGLAAADNIPDRILVLGDPASGKSSMLDRLDMIQARRARGSEAEPIPVLIRLKGLAEPSVEVIKAKIMERLGSSVDEVIGKRRMVLLIDALDEAAEPSATAIALNELLEVEPFKSTVDRTIVTSRVLNYTSVLHSKPEALRYKGFNTTILYGLDQTAIEKRILVSSLTTDQKAKIMQKLALSSSRSAWLQFLRMPMNFDLISEIMGDLEPEDIAHGQSEILRRFVKHRFVQKEFTPSAQAAGNELLRTIALRTLSDGVAARSREFEARDALPVWSPAESANTMRQEQIDNVNARLAEIETTGLIRLSSPGRYRFCHLNLQDFFIAEGMTDLSMIDPTNVDWRQILLFIAGRGDSDAALSLVKAASEKGPDPYLDELLEQFVVIRENHLSTSGSFGN